MTKRIWWPGCLLHGLSEWTNPLTRRKTSGYLEKLNSGQFKGMLKIRTRTFLGHKVEVVMAKKKANS